MKQIVHMCYSFSFLTKSKIIAVCSTEVPEYNSTEHRNVLKSMGNLLLFGIS